MRFFQFEGPNDPLTGQALPISAEEHRQRAAEHQRRLERAKEWLRAWTALGHSPRAFRWRLVEIGRHIRHAEARVQHHAHLVLSNRLEAGRLEATAAEARR